MVAGFLLGAACAHAGAQALVDPMQPPAAIAAPGSAPAPAANRLQGTVTSPGRKLALIDGTVVPLGSAVSDGTLSGISDSAAVVKKNREHGVLLMHPEVDKRPARRQEEP